MLQGESENHPWLIPELVFLLFCLSWIPHDTGHLSEHDQLIIPPIELSIIFHHFYQHTPHVHMSKNGLHKNNHFAVTTTRGGFERIHSCYKRFIYIKRLYSGSDVPTSAGQMIHVWGILSVIRREVFIWSIFKKWTQCFFQHAEGPIILLIEENNALELMLHSRNLGYDRAWHDYRDRFHLFVLLEGFLQFSYLFCICFLLFSYHILLFLPCKHFLGIITSICSWHVEWEIWQSFLLLTHLFVSQKQLFLLLFIFGNYLCQFPSWRIPSNNVTGNAIDRLPKVNFTYRWLSKNKINIHMQQLVCVNVADMWHCHEYRAGSV